MKKVIFTIALCAVAAVAIVFASCNTTKKLPTQQEIETKIIGKWKVAEKEGKKYLTNKKVILTFNDKGECTHSFARDLDPFNGYFWVSKTAVPYKIENNLVSLSYKNDPEYKMMTYVVNNFSNDMFSYDEKIITQTNNEAFSMMGRHIYQRVTVDYSQDIIGLWEGVEVTGYETYGDANHRIEYHADGTYTYYVKDGDDWVPSSDVDNEYNVDGDWLATRWRPEAGANFNYEWWDIDYIKDNEMKWSALREKEDSTCFTTTFTWKRVR